MDTIEIKPLDAEIDKLTITYCKNNEEHIMFWNNYKSDIDKLDSVENFINEISGDYNLILADIKDQLLNNKYDEFNDYLSIIRSGKAADKTNIRFIMPYKPGWFKCNIVIKFIKNFIDIYIVTGKNSYRNIKICESIGIDVTKSIDEIINYIKSSASKISKIIYKSTYIEPSDIFMSDIVEFILEKLNIFKDLTFGTDTEISMEFCDNIENYKKEIE